MDCTKFEKKKVMSWHDQIILENIYESGQLPNKRDWESFEYFFFLRPKQKETQSYKLRPCSQTHKENKI